MSLSHVAPANSLPIALLFARCPFFKHACGGGLREAGTDVVDLDEDDIDAFGCVIECMRVPTSGIATHLAPDLYQANYTADRSRVYQSFMSAVEDRPFRISHPRSRTEGK